MAWQQYLLMKGNLREVQRVPCTLCAESPQTAFLSVENVVLLLSSKQKTKVCTDLMFIFFCFVLKFALEEYCCNQLDFYTQTPCGEPQLWAARLFLRRGFNSALLWSDEEHPHWFFCLTVQVVSSNLFTSSLSSHVKSCRFWTFKCHLCN